MHSMYERTYTTHNYTNIYIGLYTSFMRDNKAYITLYIYYIFKIEKAAYWHVGYTETSIHEF